MTLRFAIAGAGYIANYHAKAIHALDDAELIAVVEKFPEKGIPFRDAHEITGKLVKHCEKKNKNISGLSIKELKKFSGSFEKDIFKNLNVISSVNLKKSAGSTKPALVKKEIKKWNKVLKG